MRNCKILGRISTCSRPISLNFCYSWEPICQTAQAGLQANFDQGNFTVRPHGSYARHKAEEVAQRF